MTRECFEMEMTAEHEDGRCFTRVHCDNKLVIYLSLHKVSQISPFRKICYFVCAVASIYCSFLVSVFLLMH